MARTTGDKQIKINNELSPFRSKATRQWERVALSWTLRKHSPECYGRAILKQTHLRISIEQIPRAWSSVRLGRISTKLHRVAFYFRRLQRETRRRFRILKWRSLKLGKKRNCGWNYPIQLTWKLIPRKGKRFSYFGWIELTLFGIL